MKKNLAILTLTALLIDYYCANKRAAKGIAQISEVGIYYANKCDQAGIELTEFDRIAVMSMLD